MNNKDAEQKQHDKNQNKWREISQKRDYVLKLPVETNYLRLILAAVYVVAGLALMSVFGQFEQTQIPSQYWPSTVIAIFVTALFIAVTFNYQGEAKRNWRIVVVLATFFLIAAAQQTACGMPIVTSSRFDPLGLIQLGLAFLIIAGLAALFYALTNRPRLSIRIVLVMLLVLACINFFLLKFRGDPFYFGDLLTANTGMEVAKNYAIGISGTIIAGIYMAIAAYAVSTNIPAKIDFGGRKKNWLMRLGALGVTAAAVVLIMCLPIEDVYDSWTPSSNQYITAFVTNAKLLHIPKPSGYSAQSAEQIVKKGSKIASAEVKKNTDAGKKATEAVASGKKPTIIAVMNESFSDLSVLGNFQTNEDYMPFFRSLSKNTVRGNLYVDVYGAGTCNTEYSFLTGNSTAFLPENTRPYQMYVNYKTPSLAKNLKAQGYETYAMHPGKSSAWKRNKVYPYLGFDHTYFYEDSFTNAALTRNSYVSDRATYQKIIDLYKNRGSQPQFIFDVTIANHGGYNVGTSGMEQIKITNMPNQITNTEHTDAEEYLTLIKESDTALKEMINYFKSQDDPVAVVFFGDHQPRLDDSFYADVKGKSLGSWSSAEAQQRYITPYIIWTNYDIQSQSNKNLSVNYLQTELLQTLGLKTTDYNKYEQAMYDKMPVLNSKGAITADGDYLTLDDAEKYNTGVQNYQKVLYNNMFDKKGYKRSLYLLKGAPDGKSDQELRSSLEAYRKKYGNSNLMNVVN
ncbi:MAG: sulfatase-like hydrolase/transferase [Pseudoramibacter sp.]